MPITKPPAVAVAHGVRSGAAGGGGGPTAFVSDTFTGADATTLASHTGETGATWTQHAASTATMQIITNRLRGTASSGFYYASGVPASADYDVAADYVLVTDNNSSSVGIRGRCDTSANTCYWTRYTSNNDTWELLKSVAGANTSLGTLGDGIAGSMRITLRMVGNQITVLRNGLVIIGPVTDSAISAAGRAGVYGAGTSGDAVGIHLDNFTAT